MSEVPLSVTLSYSVLASLKLMREVPLFRDCSKSRTRTAIGPYGRAMPRSIGPP